MPEMASGIFFMVKYGIYGGGYHGFFVEFLLDLLSGGDAHGGPFRCGKLRHCQHLPVQTVSILYLAQ